MRMVADPDERSVRLWLPLESGSHLFLYLYVFRLSLSSPFSIFMTVCYVRRKSGTTLSDSNIAAVDPSTRLSPAGSRITVFLSGVVTWECVMVDVFADP